MRAPFRGEWRTLDVYRRLAVAARVKGEDALRLKLYREIPVSDLEALLPHARVRMGLFDQITAFGGGAGSLGGVATKIIAGGAILTAQFFWLVFAAMGGLAIKSFLGYRRTRKDRDGRRIQHLYSQHMAANAAVLHSVLTHIEQEEVKDGLLAYAALCDTANPPKHLGELEHWVSAWLKERFDVDVRFDAADGVETLERVGIIERHGDMRVLGIGDAVQRLDDHWRQKRTYGYHQKCAGVEHTDVRSGIRALPGGVPSPAPAAPR